MLVKLDNLKHYFNIYGSRKFKTLILSDKSKHLIKLPISIDKNPKTAAIYL